MKVFSRYAVYYAPEAGLAAFGARWLGWDAQTGQARSHLPNTGLPIAELTETPRKYGLHGTLKPPFKLAEGRMVEDLDAALTHLASQQPSFDIADITLRSINGFLAITPKNPCPALENLARACVQNLDGFRAPASPSELARRRVAGLSDAQESNLMRWGYPYVMQEFHFHLTLTGRLAPDVAKPVQQYLQAALADTLCAPLPVREICLFREAEDGYFHIIKRYALSA
ncbi:MAG: DUF1045 domain-containing protein [Rhodobacteraceae bacterium]|nr:DUF1045 domain-containing protein [Paracoccaceae bacterium]